jgi:hypothetical protein
MMIVRLCARARDDHRFGEALLLHTGRSYRRKSAFEITLRILGYLDGWNAAAALSSCGSDFEF